MATLRVYFAAVLETATSIFRLGDRGVPIKEVTTDGLAESSPSRLSVAAGTTAVLWAYATNDQTFTGFFAKLVSGDYAVVSVLVAKDSGTATAPGLPVATATRPWRWRHTDLADFAPFVLSSPNAYLNDDAANTTADTGNTLTAGYTADNQSGIDGSLPTLWAGAAVPIAGRIYKIVVRNPGTSAIEIEYAKVV